MNAPPPLDDDSENDALLHSDSSDVRSKMASLKRAILDDTKRSHSGSLPSQATSLPVLPTPVATNTTITPPTTPRRKRRHLTDSIRLSIRTSVSSNSGASQGQAGGERRDSLISPFSRRPLRTRLARTNSMKESDEAALGFNSNARGKILRNYNVGDFVLISVQQSKFANLVNRFGFPAGEGESSNEQKGPYSFVLAIVKHKHFEEAAIFYTVTRSDTKTDQRADQEFMEPIRSKQGELAAKRAATARAGETTKDELEEDESTEVPESKFVRSLRSCCYTLMFPFVWLYDLIYVFWVGVVYPTLKKAKTFATGKARMVLNGKEPFICRLRITMVNLMVICSTWFVFIDQARLVLFAPEADGIVATINFGVWLILVLGLITESFIRPDGFTDLTISDKAYAPTTVRFINNFHLIVETLCLVVFIPEFVCLWNSESCSKRYTFSFHNAVLKAMIGPTRRDCFYGRAYMALTRLRIFGLVRHWRNMWITNTFINMKWRVKRSGLFSMLIPSLGSRTYHDRKSLAYRDQLDDEKREEKIKELTLINASNIGTALMVTNSFRALIILWAITGLFPILISLSASGINALGLEMTQQLQSINLITNETSESACDFLISSINSWTRSVSYIHYRHDIDVPFLLMVDVQPYRCGLNQSSLINDGSNDIADAFGLRQGSVVEYVESHMGWIASTSGNTSSLEEFSVNTYFDHSEVIKLASLASLLLQLLLVFSVLGGLSFLRRDAEILVLGPLRRMLKIVARYAKNPLVPPKVRNHIRIINRKGSHAKRESDDISEDSDDEDDSGDSLGSYETEQLITAVTNITDLLRKCWGVAGADIISTNLATREGALGVFNPTVPGKSVYALFAFAAIDGFDHALRNLNRDVMKLINDVAKVLHDEVFRWGFGESGQCNKNLGSAFLMVFRIGLVEEVIEKLEQAQDVIWSGQTPGPSKRRAATPKSKAAPSTTKMIGDNKDRRVATKAMGLSLQSLPGISAFTDRAVIGMLKSFAGIYRDEKVLDWSKDFRLSAGVGAFRVSLIFGMDAGWAVEGAVGSEYKIDATYLSPHVNMASRMTGACKQYGVTIMLSQAVQELMSETARAKLRHVDTVTVKGSSVIQRIYTFDCKAKGVDFFLYGRSDEQADVDAHQLKSDVWTTDQDLKAMGQHVTEEFLRYFREGHRAYLKGDWPRALELLNRANDTMFQTAVEEGYLEDEFNELQIYAGQDFTKAADDLKRENGDGPSIFLINFMNSHGGIAPDGWSGWHPLTRK